MQIDFYNMCGLFLYWKTAAIRNILVYVWSISLAKDRRYSKYFIWSLWSISIAKTTAFQMGSARNIGGISLIRLQLFPAQMLECSNTVYH